METKRLVPAAQYVRMSTEDQQYSIANQEAAIQTYAKSHGYVVASTYADAGKSGIEIKHRKELRRLLHDVTSGQAQYETILVYDVSRFGRFQDVDEAAHYEFLCKSAGVPVRYCAEQFDNDRSLASSMMKALKRTMAAEYSRELGIKVSAGQRRLAHQKVEFHGETLELPLPDGPGKVLKLTIRPAQERIPIYLAVLGPKNVALAGEIADGWLPVFFSPEHTAALRAPLEEGAARAGRSLDDFRICPSVNVMIGDDVDVARNAMRPMLALYVGGMGSLEQNFYNRLVSSYGFEREAQQVQELYLAGRNVQEFPRTISRLIEMRTREYMALPHADSARSSDTVPA